VGTLAGKVAIRLGAPPVRDARHSSVALLTVCSQTTSVAVTSNARTVAVVESVATGTGT
jgi:hypothetical protein